MKSISPIKISYIQIIFENDKVTEFFYIYDNDLKIKYDILNTATKEYNILILLHNILSEIGIYDINKVKYLFIINPYKKDHIDLFKHLINNNDCQYESLFPDTIEYVNSKYCESKIIIENSKIENKSDLFESFEENDITQKIQENHNYNHNNYDHKCIML